MEPTTPPQKPSDHPVWGPPTVAPINRVRTPPQRRPAPAPRSGRSHPAHRARRFAGMATLASSAAIIGYMATAGAANPASHAVVTPIVLQPSAVTPATDPAATQPTAPSTTPRQQPQVQTRTRPFLPGLPMTSSHGS